MYYFSIGWSDILLRVFVNFGLDWTNDGKRFELRSRYHRSIEMFTLGMIIQWNNVLESY